MLPGAGIVPGGAAGIDAASAAARAAAVAQSLQSSLGFAGAAAGPAGVTNLRARIYVGSCPFEINDKQLRAIFEPFGAVKSCELLPATDATSGHAHRGYGFIEFEVRTVYELWPVCMRRRRHGVRPRNACSVFKMTSQCAGGDYQGGVREVESDEALRTVLDTRMR